MATMRWSVLVLLLAMVASVVGGKKASLGGPSSFKFYMHNQVYNPAVNNSVFTSAYGAGPANMGQPNPYSFGVRSTFEMPITTGRKPSSKRIGVAQGLWVSDSLQGFSLLHMFTANITSGQFTGQLVIFGQLVESRATRVLAVVGGTGDFLAARGVAYNKLVSINTTDPSSWTLSFNLNLYY